MKKWALLLGVTLLFAGIAGAQENPAMELFGGYSYVHLTVSGTTFSTDANGGSGSVSFNPNSWLGLVGEFGGYTGGTSSINGTMYTYLFGPKVAYRARTFTPFVQALFGGAHITAGSKINAGSENAFATAIGGGLDWNATKRIAVRVVQADYLLTELTDGFNDKQNSLRISAGVVFRF
ncbi:MAG TPA: outer membrane beta-barrel protein [Candidatus Acidoferrum sp.]|nr:outer membrane beta-barrel protein [Candidatus Acidoferrum sp.]